MVYDRHPLRFKVPSARESTLPRRGALRIGIDCTALVAQPSGVDKYIRQLVFHLSRIDAANEYRIFVNWEDRHLFDALPANFRAISCCCRPRPVRLLFQQILLPATCACTHLDVLHSPSFLLPFCTGAQRHLLTVHDVGFLSMPDLYNSLHRSAAFRAAVRASISRADLINVPSESSRQDLRAQMPSVPAEKIRVTRFGVDDSFRPAPREEVHQHVRRLGLPDNYILFVGNIEPRKNLELLLESYRELIADGTRPEHLVIAGKIFWGADGLLRMLREPEYADRVHLTGFVRADDLPWIYRGASLFVYPSVFEGFGFPPLEAMASGVPTVCTASSALRENVDGAAELIPVNDQAALLAAMQRLLCNEELRACRQKLGLARASEFRWEQTARDVLACYQELAEK